ncbi:hypothetical protein C8R44DRAFT_880623 [Mycena epipterygia]|nr:hypothetical protein C8R44DRAFT_880623 [Mycena epipterygia]
MREPGRAGIPGGEGRASDLGVAIQTRFQVGIQLLPVQDCTLDDSCVLWSRFFHATNHQLQRQLLYHTTQPDTRSPPPTTSRRRQTPAPRTRPPELRISATYAPDSMLDTHGISPNEPTIANEADLHRQLNERPLLLLAPGRGRDRTPKRQEWADMSTDRLSSRRGALARDRAGATDQIASGATFHKQAVAVIIKRPAHSSAAPTLRIARASTPKFGVAAHFANVARATSSIDNASPFSWLWSLHLLSYRVDAQVVSDHQRT